MTNKLNPKKVSLRRLLAPGASALTAKELRQALREIKRSFPEAVSLQINLLDAGGEVTKTFTV